MTVETKSRICIEQVLGDANQPFLIHEPNITPLTRQSVIESLRNEAEKQLLLTASGLCGCLVLTHEELQSQMKSKTQSSCHEQTESSDNIVDQPDLDLLTSTEENQPEEQFVHIILNLNPLRLFPDASDNFFGARFIDKKSEIVVYVKLDLGGASYLKTIDDSSVHAQVFQPSRLHDVYGAATQGKQKKQTKQQRKALKEEAKKNGFSEADAFNSPLGWATRMSQHRNDFGLSMLLQSALIRLFKSYSRFCVLFEEIVRGGLLSRMVQLVYSEIQTCNSKCLISGRKITLGYRPGFVDAMANLNRARTSGFGFSLLRHYLKNEEHLLRYMLSLLKREASGYYSPFPCIYHDKQMQWSDYGGKLSSQMLNDIPSLEGLKKLLAGGYLQENSALPVDVINQLLWLVLSNRVYLSPTTIPNSDEIFGSKAKLYACLSVDKSFEDQYEQAKIQPQKQFKGKDKIALLYPQYQDNLFSTLTPPRINEREYFSVIEMQTNFPPKVPEYALVIQYYGKVQITQWEENYGESVGSQFVVPRLLIWYKKKAQGPEVAINSKDVISWCDQFRDSQY